MKTAFWLVLDFYLVYVILSETAMFDVTGGGWDEV